MQIMAFAALLLLFAAGVLGVLHLINPEVPLVLDETRERLPRRIGGFVLASLVLIGLLAFAQRGVCVALGGTWIKPTEACRHEIGGNGSNDPGSLSFGDILDPVAGGRG